MTVVETNGQATAFKEAREKPAVKIEMVTPATANRWLSSNDHNRKLREPRVVGLAAGLQRGEWKLTGDCICFDTDGVLLNGQHRLTAIVTADIAAPLVVLRGLPPAAQEVMDQNLKRSIGDALTLRKEKNVNHLGSMLGWMYHLDYIYATGKIHYGYVGLRPTTPQLLRILDEDHDHIAEILRRANAIRQGIMLRAGVVGAIWYRLDALDPGEAQQFFTALATGAMLEMDSPIFALRRLLLTTRQGVGRSLPDWREAAVIFKTWNLWRDGMPARTINWKYGPNHKDDFPEPH